MNSKIMENLNHLRHLGSWILLTIQYPFKLFFKWVHNILESIHAPDGWKLLVSIIAGVFVFISVWQTWLEYKAMRNNEIKQSLEKKYDSVKQSLYSKDKWIRVGAIENVYTLITSDIEDEIPVNLIDSILFVYKNPKFIKPFHKETKKVFSLYLKHMNENGGISKEELYEILILLKKLGPNGWYHGEIENSSQKTISWIWTYPIPRNIKSYENTKEFFKNLKVQKANFKNTTLEKANLFSATLIDSTFSYSKFLDSTLQEGNFSKSNFSYSSFENVNAKKVSISNADLYSSKLKNSNFEFSNIKNSNLMSTTITNCNFRNSNFLKTKLSNSEIKYSNFDSSSMNNLDMIDVNFEKSNFNFVYLQNSTLNNINFRHCSFKLADLQKVKLKNSDISYSNFFGTDLREAHFEGVTGLDTIQNWKGSNIAGVKGLSEQQKLNILSKGGVEIPNDNEWIKYKKEGIGN